MIAPVVGLPLLLGSSRMKTVLVNVLWLMSRPGL